MKATRALAEPEEILIENEEDVAASVNVLELGKNVKRKYASQQTRSWMFRRVELGTTDQAAAKKFCRRSRGVQNNFCSSPSTLPTPLGSDIVPQPREEHNEPTAS